MLSEREKMNTLRYIKRLRARMDSYQKRAKIHEENVELHQRFLDRIDEMEAMELKAVKQNQIEELETDYEEKKKEHDEIIATGKAAEPEHVHEDATEKRELEQLEKEILAEDGEAEEEEEPEEEPVLEKPVAEKPAVERSKEKPAPEEPRRAPLKVEPQTEAEESPVKVPNERRVELE